MHRCDLPATPRRNLRVHHDAPGFLSGPDYQARRRVDHQRHPHDEQYVGLTKLFCCLLHRRHRNTEPEDVRLEFAPDGPTVAELDIVVSQVRHERRGLHFPGLADLPVQAEDA